jgi:hypothetical protein
MCRRASTFRPFWTIGQLKSFYKPAVRNFSATCLGFSHRARCSNAPSNFVAARFRGICVGSTKVGRDVVYAIMRAPFPIGTYNVVDLTTVPDSVRQSVFTGPRGQGGDAIEINFVRMTPPATDLVLVMLNRSEKGCALETAYPGPVVTDIPQPAKHSAAELAFCRRAWQTMAFVEPIE